MLSKYNNYRRASLILVFSLILNYMKSIAVIMGGHSDEKVISIKSGKVVVKNLQTDYFQTYAIVIDKNSWNLLIDNKKYSINKENFSVNVEGEHISFDAVFIAIHGTPGEDGKIQAYLDELEIPYTGSSSSASALSFNKKKCNDYLRDNGILCAPSYLLHKKKFINESEILKMVGLPCFVKPNKNGSSFGISKVVLKENLQEAIEKAFTYDDEILIESFIKGTEVTCGIHNFEKNLTTFPITEIISENDFFDFEAKYEGRSQEITPARISNKVAQKVSNKTKEIYSLLNLNGIARIDFIIQNNEPYIIEVNTVPGLSQESIIPQQAAHAGINLKDLFQTAVRHAIK